MECIIVTSGTLVKAQNGHVFVNNDHRTPEQREADGLFKLMGITSDWEIENIKEVAMNRFNVKAGKRPHIKRILDDAFQQLKEKGKMHGHF